MVSLTLVCFCFFQPKHVVRKIEEILKLCTYIYIHVIFVRDGFKQPGQGTIWILLHAVTRQLK